KRNCQIIITAVCMCLVVVALGFLLGITLQKFEPEVAGDLSSVAMSEFQSVNAEQNLSETNPVATAKPEVVETAKPTLAPTETAKPTEELGKGETVINNVENFLNNEVFPLIAGLATGLMTILALIVPYIKTIGKLKSTQSAYATVYDEHEKLIGLAKEFDSENVKKDIIEKVVTEVESRFEKYDKALGAVLGQEEIISAQISALIEGAKLAWKQADGASIVLAQTPTATAIEKQALAIEFMKTLIANELGLKKEELESRMNKELSK
ncbi:MAG: hypothetical protein RR327_01595, partial [Clostridia bacterium]